MCRAPAKAGLVLSGSPPPVSIAWFSDRVPPRLRIDDQACPATFASKVTGRPGPPLATRLPLGVTVTVPPLTMRTTAHSWIVTGAATLMSNGTMCGLPASVQVSAALMLPWVVPAPVGAVHGRTEPTGPQVRLRLVTSALPTVPLTNAVPAIAPGPVKKQVWLVGWMRTLMLKPVPLIALVSLAANTKLLLVIAAVPS